MGLDLVKLSWPGQKSAAAGKYSKIGGTALGASNRTCVIWS